MKKRLESLLEKLKIKKKEIKKIVISPDSIRCVRCGKVVKKRKATMMLPESIWVCDECFFGYAEFILDYPPEGTIHGCEVCEGSLEGNWCTRNVCKQCCEEGKCPIKDKCHAYPEVLVKVIERSKEEIIKNPSKRQRNV